MKENDFLQWLGGQPPAGGAGGGKNRVILGPGDDMAVVAMPAGLLGQATEAFLKIDQALDQVHFDLRRHTPRQAGRKAVNRCLSDCAAMGCRPLAVLVSVALPREATLTFAQELFLGCQGAAHEAGCAIVGGDTAVWNQRLAITVAALGGGAGAPMITRGGARPGDVICVTGKLGGSILGRHMEFSPRIQLAERLRTTADIHAMMDLSDGLAADLPRLCAASGVGAVVQEGLLPVHDDARRLAEQDGVAASWHALVDGEDYELLFATTGAEAARAAQTGGATAVTVIGEFTEDLRLVLRDAGGRDTPWPAGFEHSSENASGQRAGPGQAGPEAP